MSERAIICSAIVYAAIAVVTFGHAAAASEKYAQDSASVCEAKGETKYCNGAIMMPEMNGLAAAIVWPLYWSWELQS